MNGSFNGLKNPQHGIPEPNAASKALRNWPLNFLAILISLMLLEKIIGSSKSLTNPKQGTVEPDATPKVQSTAVPDAAPKDQSTAELNAVPKVLGKWQKYCFVLLINLLLWLCIGLGIFVALLVGNWLGFTETLPAKVASTAKFFDGNFLKPLVVGILVMIVMFLAINYIILKLREKFPFWNKINREVISDSKFREIFHSEIIGQVNNIANLAMFSGLILFYDQSKVGIKILEASSVHPYELLIIAVVLYCTAAVFYWKFVDD